MTRIRKPDKIEKVVIMEELPTPDCTYTFIPELKLNIKLKKGQTIDKWVRSYCRRNTHLKPILYPIYNVKI